MTLNPAQPDFTQDDKLCNPNQSVTATKTVTVTATITWDGPFPSPRKITAKETATVSWSAEIHRSHDSVTIGVPPDPPSGSVSGSGSSGLNNEVTTFTPDP